MSTQALFSQQLSINGPWKGFMEAAGRKMDIIVLFEKSEGEWKGKLSSETQQLKDIAISNIVVENLTVTFDVPLAGGQWAGQLSKEGDKLAGDWIQGAFKATLNFAKQKEAPEFKIKVREQTPVGPFPYKVQEVSYKNERDGTTLAATLTTPNGEGPFPAAILLTVAGENDRDQSHGAPQHKPYLVLADYLTRQGVAVLRADDRGVGGSSGNIFDSTIEDFAYDALAGFNFLKGLSQIDNSKIGFIGNSEGTLVGPLAASINNETAFIITLGGIGITGAEVILDQVDAMGQLSQLNETTIAQMKDRTQKMFDILLSEPDRAKAAAKLRAFLEDSKVPGADSSLFLIPASIDAQAKMFSSPWYRYQTELDPAPVLQKIKCPFLALHGNVDPFVSPDKNLAAIAENLRIGGNQHYGVIKLKGINHVFQDAQTGSPADYTKNEVSFSPRALELIGSWLKSTLMF